MWNESMFSINKILKAACDAGLLVTIRVSPKFAKFLTDGTMGDTLYFTVDEVTYGVTYNIHWHGGESDYGVEVTFAPMRGVDTK